MMDKQVLKKLLDQFQSEYDDEQIQNYNLREIKLSEEEYKRFRESYNKNLCYLCDQSLDSVKEDHPCVHWLLRKNNRFKKNDHFMKITHKFGYFQIQSYLRWCASIHNSLLNINDLPEEVTNPQNFEATIKFNNLEWTFSCSDSDLIGHKNTASDFPHYHFQMKINNLPFIKFNDFHVPLSHHDVFTINLFKYFPDKFTHSFGRGEGFHGLLEKLGPEEIINKTLVNSNDTHQLSTHRLSSSVTAINGGVISGDLIADLIEQSKKTGESLTKLLRNQESLNVTTVISPVDSLPEFAQRSGRSKKS